MSAVGVDKYEDDALVRRLSAMDGKKDKLVRSTTYISPVDQSISVKSWRMNEFKYYKVPSPFPTLARGLFTVWEPADSREPDDAQKEAVAKDEKGTGRYRIVARGYDKFFNIGEVPWTTWTAIEKHTDPPYELTVKANGCIIFIAALTPSKLLVTSKHSMGEVAGATVSHAQKGEEWLHTHLLEAGKTTEQLAECLWSMGCTAVAELCDDSFEEHVLPYSSEKTGLHLHGINGTTGAFQTLPSEVVQQFSRQWGFIETPFIILNTVKEVRNYTDEAAETGKWRGEPVEGFVVRCRIAEKIEKEMSDAPPYPPGSSFFFKVKFNEPYMMYRDWREITKSLLRDNPTRNASTTHRSRLKRPETRMYYNWVKSEIERNLEQFKGFKKGKGIIATRERFLRWLESSEGGKARLKLNSEQLDGVNHKETKVFDKTVIVPVAIPGSGKTTVAVALKTLFGFGHVQSDDSIKKDFAQRVKEKLKTHGVVIADKNNHMTLHRDQLRTMIKRMGKPIRLLALYWDFDKSDEAVLRICADRITERGNNHQTLIADEDSQEHEDVIRQFIRQRDELDEGEVDEVVDMEIDEELENMVMRAVDACVRILGRPQPSTEDIGLALAAARGYVPDTVDGKNFKPGKKQKERPVRYFGFAPKLDLMELVGSRLVQSDVPESARAMWDVIVEEERVAQQPHITIVHMKEKHDREELWEASQALSQCLQPIKFVIGFGSIVWNERVMALVVEDLKIERDEVVNEDAERFMELLAEEELRSGLHVTIGTRSKDIKPFEARAMIRNWRSGKDTDGIGSLAIKDFVAMGEIRGLLA